jgi:DNA-binding transcriptional ArsR family regulator
LAKRAAGGTADAYEAVFAALAHPARRHILIGLDSHGGTMTAGEIARLFGHSWPTTTRHLGLLEAAGILRGERRGRVRLYRLVRPRLALACAWLAPLCPGGPGTAGGR